MGPEVTETTLLLTNSYIIGMYGIEDSDALFLDVQQPGQTLQIIDSVLADGDDDGIDTLSAIFTVKNSIIRDWKNPFEDSKGISIENGEARIDHCLLVDNTLGISAKGGNAVTIPVNVNQSTILSQNYAVGATNKSGTSPTIVFNITNSIVRGEIDSVFTQYNPADIHFYYCNIGESWAGVNCSFSDPLFVNSTNHDFALQSISPLIDAGDPAPPKDFDGSVRDVGFYAFVPKPWLGIPQRLPDGNYSVPLKAFPNRDYAVEYSGASQGWSPLTVIFQSAPLTNVIDSTATNAAVRFYRAKLVPRP
jgi:hypothetical protein